MDTNGKARLVAIATMVLEVLETIAPVGPGTTTTGLRRRELQRGSRQLGADR